MLSEARLRLSEARLRSELGVRVGAAVSAGPRWPWLWSGAQGGRRAPARGRLAQQVAGSAAAILTCEVGRAAALDCAAVPRFSNPGMRHSLSAQALHAVTSTGSPGAPSLPA